MTTPSTDRHIRESLLNELEALLVTLGWSAVNTRKYRAVELLREPVSPTTQITPTKIALLMGDMDDDEAEIGSTATIDRHHCTIDIFGETEAIGVDLSSQIRDWLRGRLPSIGRTSPTLTVYDHSTVTPTELFTCTIEGVARDRASGWSQPWLQFWWAVNFTIEHENLEVG